MTVKTTCPYCGVGCGVKVTIAEDPAKGFTRLEGDDSHPANLGKLCVKGSNLAATLVQDDRLLQPKIHGQDVLWQDAVDHVAEKITQTLADHGPDAFAFYLSGQILTEDYYVANKFAKGFLGTANVDTNSRLCMASAVVGYKRAFGADTVPCSYEDLELCDLLIMVGSNAAWTHPILFQRIAAAKAKRPDMKVVVIDPRKTATCDIADLHLAIEPGSDAAIFNFLLLESQRQQILDAKFIKKHTKGFANALWAAQKHQPSIAEVAKYCDVSKEDLATLSEWWCNTKKTVSFYSQGVNQSSSGVDKCNAIINCHLATGRIGKEGMGPFSITGQPNAMGGREVGGLSNQLAAHMDFATPGAIDLVQRFWQAPNMARDNGLKAVDMFQAIEAGKIKVLWIMSTNPLVSLPDTEQVRRALAKCELVIVSDCKAHTDTTAYADVLLPALPWSEKDGTVTNSERRISRQRGLLPPLGQAQPDWWAICQVAQAMGYYSGFAYRSVDEIFREHAALSGFENNGQRDFDISYFSQINVEQYQALTPIQWPVTKDKPNGSTRMFGDGKFFTQDGKANFVPIYPEKPVAKTTKKFPFILNTGRVRDQWHTMTRTGDAAILVNHTSEPYLEIHPEDAAELKIQQNAIVEVSSTLHSIKLRAKISDHVRPKNLFAPIHWTRQFASQTIVSSLIPQTCDALSGQPESKHAIVKVSAIEGLQYGYVISKKLPAMPEFDYWCRVPLEQGERLEVACRQPSMIEQLCRQIEHQWPPGQWLSYQNPINQQQRRVYIVDEKVVAFVLLQLSPALPSSAWLEEQLFSSGTMTEMQRMALLAGRAVDREDKGSIVCSCFQVGAKQIEQAVTAGASSVVELGKTLKCGTNCGSCIPEIKQFIPVAEVAL